MAERSQAQGEAVTLDLYGYDDQGKVISELKCNWYGFPDRVTANVFSMGMANAVVGVVQGFADHEREASKQLKSD